MKSLIRNQKQHSSGFTLLELIIVIMIVAIMAISLSNISKNAVYGYIDAKDRNRFSQSSKWVVERISREIREAIPQSVRVSSSGNIHCVEFMSIINSSTYLNLPASGVISSFNAVKYNLGFSSNLQVAIMPIDSASLYSGSGGVRAAVTSIIDFPTDPTNQVVIEITPTDFSNRSPLSRFYLLNSPVSICLNDGDGSINRYAGYGILPSQPFSFSSGTSSLMGEDFSANGPVFTFQSGTLSRAGLLQMNFRSQNRNRNLTGNSESFEVFHEVHIRNVP